MGFISLPNENASTLFVYLFLALKTANELTYNSAWPTSALMPACSRVERLSIVFPLFQWKVNFKRALVTFYTTSELCDFERSFACKHKNHGH